MATNISGIGGAIDVGSIVSSLMEIERQPLQALNQRASGLRTTISEFGRLQSALDTFQSASRDLTSLTTWQAASASSADEESVGVRADGGALQGNYALKVNTLAAHQTLVTNPVAERTEVIGGGSLTIQMGTVDGSFAADPERDPVVIAIDAGATLEQVAQAINSADAGIGASLVRDEAGTRLMIRSEDSGANQAFQVSATADGSSAGAMSLTDLAYVPGQVSATLTRTQEASNATFELNGLALESASNSPEGVLENVTFSFKKVTATPVDISINSDAESIRERMDAFVGAYNELNGIIQEQTRYDASSGVAGPLQGNRTALRVQSQLRDVLRTALPEDPANPDAYTRMSDIGLEIQRDGSLSIDSARFELASANPDRLETLFANGGADESVHGFARRFDTLVGQMLGLDGAITGATESLEKREDLIEEQQDRLNQRLEAIEQRLIRQYSALDANLSDLSGSLAAISRLNT